MVSDLAQILEQSNQKTIRYNELEDLVSAPEIIAHNSYLLKLDGERRILEPIARAYKDYVNATQTIKELQDTLSKNVDEEYKILLLKELSDQKELLDASVYSLKILSIPEDSASSADIELKMTDSSPYAQSFFQDIIGMFVEYAKKLSIKTKIEQSDIVNKGASFAIIHACGKGAQKIFCNEGGFHRGIKTVGKVRNKYTVSVAVLPCIPLQTTQINENDIRIDLYHSSGAGGQNINKVETAVRITHFPTGIVVNCQDERSQLKNRNRAYETLKTKLAERDASLRESELNKERKRQIDVGTGRLIRTYDYDKLCSTDYYQEVAPLADILAGNIGFIQK